MQTLKAPLAFGLRVWVSMCLALFVAYWLQLENPFWAGTSAGIVCRPSLGASLRKATFRHIAIDHLPAGMRLEAGQTARVEIVK